ncbi:MFS transporter [Exiguobacterium sp. s193]|uniref:MFS transporter n=1 Tax=Exiguobacterium sp. s193 TaxID=2751207 RepID=UPI001BE6200D|nr:MFS transporter [Exiguobacterium sp. s193]
MMRFATAFIPAYVIERLFWEARGMSVLDVIYAEIVFALTQLSLELPFGRATDSFGRKWFLVFGMVAECLSFAILLNAYTLAAFLSAMVLAGIGATAISGTEEAFLYETLEQIGRVERFERIVGRLNAVSLMTAGLAALTGSWLTQSTAFEFHYTIALVSLMSAALISLTLRETRSEVEESTARPLRLVWRELRTRPILIRIFLFSIVFGTTINFIEEFWQLSMRDRGIPVTGFGLVFIFIMVAQGAGNLLPALKKGSLKAKLNGMLIVFFVSVVSFSFTEAVSLIFLFVTFLLYGLSEPMTSSLLQTYAAAKERATIVSFVAWLESILIIVVGLGFGFVSEWVSLNMAYVYLCLVSFVLWLCVTWLSRRWE